MALELQQTGFFGARQKGVVARLIAQEEGDIHARAAVLGHLVHVKARLIDIVVEQIGLGDIARLHGGHASQRAFCLLLEPFERQACHVNAPGRGRVVHAAVVGHGLVIKGAGADGQGVAQQVFAHDDDGQACRANVLLRAAKGQAHAAPVDGARCDVRGKVDDQWRIRAQRFQVGQLLKLHAVNRFVAADVHVACAAAQVPAAGCGDRGVVAVLARGNHIGFAGVLDGFLGRLLAPAAGHHKIGHAGARKVHGHDGVFSQTAALHEQNLEMGGHGQQLTQIGFRGFVNADEFLAAMAHFHHAHARAVPVQHFGGCGLQHFFRDSGGACGEVIGAVHQIYAQNM